MKNKGIIQVGDKSYIRAKVVMLATEKPSKIVLENTTKTLCMYEVNRFVKPDTNGFSQQHLYFLSEEEVKQGDCVRHTNNDVGVVLRIYDGLYDMRLLNNDVSTMLRIVNSQKIIATTDESLKVDYYDSDSYGKPQKLSLPRPSNEFLQAYCKANGKIEEVLVEMEYLPKLMVENPPIEYFKPKVSPDSTITIKKVGEKVYLRDEVEKKLFEFNKWRKGQGKMGQNEPELICKWIEENL